MGNSQARILLVDDDSALRDILQTTLELEEYAVIPAENGEIAQQLLEQNKDSINVVISDIRMPKADGISVLKYAKSIDQKIPVILMTGIAEMIQTKKAVDLGADDFIAKPFKPSELLTALDNILKSKTKETTDVDEQGRDSEFCKVWLDDFTTGSKLEIDLYVRLTAKKYLKIARKGNFLDPPRVEAYKSRGLNYLYIPKEEFAKYVGFNLNLTTALTKTGGKDVSKQKKLKLFKHTTEMVLEQTNINGVTKGLADVANTLVSSTLSLMSEDDDMFMLLDILNSHSDAVYAHSIAVGVYSALIATEIAWTSLPTKSKLVMAGLFHDIGKKEIPQEILEKRRENLNGKELKLLESHVIRGKNILLKMSKVPSDVVLAVSQHHEACNGQGYPDQLTVHKIHPLAKILFVADTFSNLVVKGITGNKPMEPHEAIQQLLDFHLGEVDPHALTGLMKAFNFTIPKEFEKYIPGRLRALGN